MIYYLTQIKAVFTVKKLIKHYANVMILKPYG